MSSHPLKLEPHSCLWSQGSASRWDQVRSHFTPQPSSFLLSHSSLQCTAVLLNYIALHSTIVQGTARHCAALYCNAYYCCTTQPWCTAALEYTALHCTVDYPFQICILVTMQRVRKNFIVKRKTIPWNYLGLFRMNKIYLRQRVLIGTDSD